MQEKMTLSLDVPYENTAASIKFVETSDLSVYMKHSQCRQIDNALSRIQGEKNYFWILVRLRHN